MKRHIVLLLILTIFSWSASIRGAGVSEEQRILDGYIAEALKKNLDLKQEQFSIEKSKYALKEAKGMLLPSVSIEARYSRAGGGRIIEMPIGDLVNPVHQALNQLLKIHGLTPGFPGSIPNQQIPFLREKEHDSKVRLIQPLFQPGIYYNVKIKKELMEIEKARVTAFKRELVEDIKVTYYNYLETVKIGEVLQSTRELLEENLHFCESLYKNNAVTEEVVLRSKAELSKLDQQQAEADKNKTMAASYFNFLLDRPFDADIETRTGPDTPVRVPSFAGYDLNQLMGQALRHRAEFVQLQAAVDATRHTSQLHKSGILPTLSAVVDWGFQGETYRFTSKDDYWMGSVVLSWNLFRGGQDRAKQEQALADKKRLETQQSELENQVRLQVQDAFLALDVAKKSVISSADTLDSQEKAFGIITKKYRQDMVPQIEYLKARNDFTAAAVGYVIAIYDYYIKEARLERASALYDFTGSSSEPFYKKVPTPPKIFY